MSRVQNGLPVKSSLPISAPPYELAQDEKAFDLYFNMYGIPESGIRIGVDQKEKSFTVFAEREKQNFTDQFLWVFSLPQSIDVNSVETFYKKGTVQFHFPKKGAA
jgi:HSP20 family molecular chaperone IbpA